MCVVCLMSPCCLAFLVSLELVSVPPRGPRHLPVPVPDTLALSLEPSALPVWRPTTALLAWRECDDCSGFRLNNALSSSYSGSCRTMLCIGSLLSYSEVQEVKRISSVYAVLEHQPTWAVLKFPRHACFSAGHVDCMADNAPMVRMLEHSLMVSVWFKHDTLFQSKMLGLNDAVVALQLLDGLNACVDPLWAHVVDTTWMRHAVIPIVIMGLTARVGAATSLRLTQSRMPWSRRMSSRAAFGVMKFQSPEVVEIVRCLTREYHWFGFAPGLLPKLRLRKCNLPTREFHWFSCVHLPQRVRGDSFVHIMLVQWSLSHGSTVPHLCNATSVVVPPHVACYTTCNLVFCLMN